MKSAQTPDGDKLGREIVALSVATTWDKARLEWGIDEIYIQE